MSGLIKTCTILAEAAEKFKNLIGCDLQWMNDFNSKGLLLFRKFQITRRFSRSSSMFNKPIATDTRIPVALSNVIAGTLCTFWEQCSHNQEIKN